MDKQPLFPARQDGYHTCRIPGIIQTPRGIVLAYSESRYGRGSDWDAIDIRMRRSLDRGQTWELAQVVVDHKDYTRTLSNFVCVGDQQSGRVTALFTSDYEKAWHIYSDDDGETWSPAEDITACFDGFRSGYAFSIIAIGPGHGIQLTNNRLIVPAWVSPGTGPGSHRPNRCGCIFSDDGGMTWQAGGMIPDSLSCCNEAEMVQLQDGRLLINMRHAGNSEGVPSIDVSNRAIAYSDNNGQSWSEPIADPQLPDPVCFASIIRYDASTLLFSNCASHEQGLTQWSRDRRNLCVRISHDEGETWSEGRSIEPGVAGYSDLCVLDDQTILCLYEDGMFKSMYDIRAISVARFYLNWIEHGTLVHTQAASSTV